MATGDIKNEPGAGILFMPDINIRKMSGKEGIGRVFYCTQIGQAIVILHSLVKKTNTTPAADLQLARKRLKEVNHG